MQQSFKFQCLTARQTGYTPLILLMLAIIILIGVSGCSAVSRDIASAESAGRPSISQEQADVPSDGAAGESNTLSEATRSEGEASPESTPEAFEAVPSDPNALSPTETSAPAGQYTTNWTLTDSGQILWYDPAPSMIPYSAARTVSVTVPEGYTLVDICKLLEKKGVQTFYHTFSAAQNGDYPSYAFADASRAVQNRRYALEGYLFPDTYLFHVGEKPANIWAKFLSKTNSVLASYTPYPGMTLDQVLTLASLIEEEAFTGETRTNVSSVLHNRLAAGQKLELDKTINYVEWYIKPLIQSSDTTIINAYNSYYNTYKCPGLPAGPITNPGRLAIEAALNPAITNYYYFVTDEAGNYYYAATWEEHQANLVTAGLA